MVRVVAYVAFDDESSKGMNLHSFLIWIPLGT